MKGVDTNLSVGGLSILCSRNLPEQDAVQVEKICNWCRGGGRKEAGGGGGGAEEEEEGDTDSKDNWEDPTVERFVISTPPLTENAKDKAAKAKSKAKSKGKHDKDYGAREVEYGQVLMEMSTVVRSMRGQCARSVMCAASGSNQKLNSCRGLLANSGSPVCGLRLPPMMTMPCVNSAKC